jgi:hypothetical protein
VKANITRFTLLIAITSTFVLIALAPAMTGR